MFLEDDMPPSESRINCKALTIARNSAILTVPYGIGQREKISFPVSISTPLHSTGQGLFGQAASVQIAR